MPADLPEQVAPRRSLTVGGLPGTGTSTICRLLENRTGLPYVYVGQLFRQEAAQRGVTLAALNELSQTDPSVDRRLDDYQLGLLRTGGVILEGRMAGWLAHTHGLPAVTVWVVCDLEERVRRIVDRDGGDTEVQRAETLDREAREADRYRRYYGADPNDASIYDLALDSTNVRPEVLVARILEGREENT